MELKWNGDPVQERLKQRLLDKLEVVGQFVEDSAVLLCPVDTGNLRGSITHRVLPDELATRIGTNVEYAPYIEFGTGEFAENGKGRKGGWFVPLAQDILTRKATKGFFTFGNKPQPFLRPALENNRNTILKIVSL